MQIPKYVQMNGKDRSKEAEVYVPCLTFGSYLRLPHPLSANKATMAFSSPYFSLSLPYLCVETEVCQHRNMGVGWGGSGAKSCNSKMSWYFSHNILFQ